MFAEAISKKTLAALDLVVKYRTLPPNTYLAGGTAAALHLGHRYSNDLDFFTPRRFDAKDAVKKFKKIPGYELEKTSWQTILGYVNTVQCTLFFYQYPLLFPTKSFRGVAVADLRDISAMKIAAISDRGIKRDFVDLYFTVREGGVQLKDALRFYGRKFGVLEANRVHLLKSLVYFEDAEKQITPRMIKNAAWPDVKKFFESEVKKLI